MQSRKILVPPLKSQGIKTKLTPWILDIVEQANIDKKTGVWVEPFFGTGVVGFNSGFSNIIAGDTNPHIINFYNQIKSGKINYQIIREYLDTQNELLKNAENEGYAHYSFVKDRFNTEFAPLDFLFLSRAGFNGMMRFNSKGKWNIPFCKKPDRFAQAYVTKICNQINNIQRIILQNNCVFNVQSFQKTIESAQEHDIIYCDPPYYGRHVDYYNGWTENDEENLFELLNKTKAKFILSTWHHNNYRKNDMITKYWNKFNCITKDHFYHSGGRIGNRQSIVEALVFNFNIDENFNSGKVENSLLPDSF